MNAPAIRLVPLALMAAAGLWAGRAGAACTVLTAPPVAAQATLQTTSHGAPAALRLAPVTLRLDVRCDSAGRFTLRVADPAGERPDGALLLQGSAGQVVRVVPRLRRVDGREVNANLGGQGGGFSEMAQPGHIYRFEIDLTQPAGATNAVRGGRFQGLARVTLEE